MKKKKKGFTLIELLATIIILGIVMTIGGFAISSIITSSKENNQKMLVSNIKTAAEDYYQECKHDIITATDCNFEGDFLKTPLKKLINYGYLTSNKTKDQEGKLYNQINGDEISNCTIKIVLVASDNKIYVYKDSDTATENTSSHKTINCIDID